MTGKKIYFLIKSYYFVWHFLVKIESSKSLKGAFIQGRKMNGTDALGTFINIPSETHLVSCSTVCKIKSSCFSYKLQIEFFRVML
jgi:hypothetical protein